jgi:rRNA maturation endonuclease Nob1
MIRCPGCGKLFNSLAEAGAKQLGLSLKAECDRCGKRWSVGHLWRKVQTEVKR